MYRPMVDGATGTAPDEVVWRLSVTFRGWLMLVRREFAGRAAPRGGAYGIGGHGNVTQPPRKQ